MSHFTVLVIGDDAESQLEPYNENMEVTEYFDEVVSEEEKERFVTFYHEKHDARGTFEEIYSEWGDDWNGGRWRKEDVPRRRRWKCESCEMMNTWKAKYCGEFFAKVSPKGCASPAPKNHFVTIWNSYSTYNPDSKWDWYVLGGRWKGYFRLKPGRTGELGEAGVFDNEAPELSADSALKADIDFEFMRDLAGKTASVLYDEFWNIVDGRALPRWDEIRKKHGKNIDKARDEYHDIDVIKDLDASDKFSGMFFFFNDILDFEESRGDYVQRARNSAIVTYALVKDGKWYQRGEMGWFGMAFNEMDEHEWNKQFHKLLDELPDATLLSVYDCHI